MSPSARNPASATASDLGVQRRVVDADRLDADLLELAVAAGLRTLVAEERARVAELDRQRARGRGRAR